MKTTEIFVEQVLIGLLVILNVGLIKYPSKAGLDEVNLKEGAALVAIAYLYGRHTKIRSELSSFRENSDFQSASWCAVHIVGIIFDRFADTVLEDIEQRTRLKLAYDVMKRPPKPGEMRRKDPLPEHEYRMKVLQNREAFTYANYLRTRIRLSRAMALLIPGLSVSFLIGKRAAETDPKEDQMWELVFMVMIYGGALIAQLIRPKRSNESSTTTPASIAEEIGKEAAASCGESHRPVKIPMPETERVLDKSSQYKIRWYKVPKTNNPDVLKHYLDNQPALWAFSIQEPFFWMVISLTGLGFFLARPTPQGNYFAVPVISILLTLLTTWTWWRINKTFLIFLRDFSEYPSEKANE